MSAHDTLIFSSPNPPNQNGIYYGERPASRILEARDAKVGADGSMNHTTSYRAAKSATVTWQLSLMR